MLCAGCHCLGRRPVGRRGKRCLKVTESKEGVGKLELLAAQVGINRLLGLAGGLGSAPPPELAVEIGVRRRVTVALELIGICSHYEAGHVAHLCRFLTVSILEAVSA